MMHPLKGIRTFLSDNADQVNYRVTTLHALIQPLVFDYVACDEFNSVRRELDGSGGIAHQRADGMALGEQSPEHMPPNKAGGAGEKDSHGMDCNRSKHLERDSRFQRRCDKNFRSPYVPANRAWRV